MEPLEAYLTKEGWQNDWQKTKDDFSKLCNYKSLADKVKDKDNSVKTSSMCYFFGGLFLVTGTIHLSLMSEDPERLALGTIRYLISGGLFYFAGRKRSEGD